MTFGVAHEFHNDLVIELYAAAAAEGYELVLSGITPDAARPKPCRNCCRCAATGSSCSGRP